ncbi:enoyl-CoA hydratase/isomerase family protein [Mariniluteicoccus flavus]
MIETTRHGDHVVELVMNRPEAMNAVSTQQARDLSEACKEIAADAGVRAVVLSSALPKAYCVGADLKERNGFGDDELRAQREVFRACFGAVHDLPVPAIAAVEGFAMGGGFELALCCDLVVASETAVFALPELGVGVIPGGGGTQLLSRRIGLNRAADVIFTGRRIDVAEGERMGFVDRRVATGSARDAALELAALVATKSPIGARNAKRALVHGFDLPVADGLRLEHEGWQATAFSPDRVEGVAAFNEKRAPRWS